jgi:DNA polymerase IV
VLGPELRTPEGALAVLKKLLVKAAMRLRRDQLLAGAMTVAIRFVGYDERWESSVHFDPTDDSRNLLHLLAAMLDAGRVRRRPLPGPARAVPLSVSVTLMRLAERTQTSGSLFASTHDTRKVDTVVDRINTKYGLNKVYFGGMQAALMHDAAPMRIPFNRIPDGDSEQEAGLDPLWLQSLNRFKAIAEGEHRRREKERSDGRGEKPSPGRS